MACAQERSQDNSCLLQQTEDGTILDHRIPFINYSELHFVRHIARGGMADISLYGWQRTDNPPLYVVKKSLFRGSLTKRYAENLKKEMGILMCLEHQNIVQTFGAVETDHDFGLIMEYHPCGSCKNFFDTLREGVVERETNLEETMAPLKIEIAEEIVDGMKYLHGIKPKKVLHLDLKSDNVLLDGELHAKICDFGLSRMSTLTLLRNRTTVEMGGVAGTPGHIPPERLRNPLEKPTTKSDVYSFAILLWEILTDKMAYEELSNQDLRLLTHYVINQNGRPGTDCVPGVFPQQLIDIMKSSWAAEPKDRPSFEDLQKEIMMIKSRNPQFGKQAESSRRRTLELWQFISAPYNQDSITDQKRYTAPYEIQGTLQTHSRWTARTTPSQPTASNQDSMTVPKQHTGQSQSQPNLPSARLEQINESDEEKNLGPFSAPAYDETSPLIKSGPPSYELGPAFLPGNEETRWFSRKKILFAITIILLLSGTGLLIWWITSTHTGCPNLSDPVHGKVSCADATLSQNEKCTFSCDDGYGLSGEDTVVCAGGKWNAKPPICVPECAALSPLAHGEIACTNHYMVNSVCTFTCIDAHLLKGNTSAKCLRSVKWSNPEPACVCPQCYVGYRCEDSISWEEVDKALSPMEAYGTITVNYGGQLFTCTTELHSVTIHWTGKCTDKETGTMTTCSNNYVSPRVSAKHAAAQLIRILADKKIYSEPCDPQNMPTGC